MKQMFFELATEEPDIVECSIVVFSSALIRLHFGLNAAKSVWTLGTPISKRSPWHSVAVNYFASVASKVDVVSCRVVIAIGLGRFHPQLEGRQVAIVQAADASAPITPT